ncbi:Tubulointerstitial nephritis antigen-like [Folsomia candida]|uniref:Tubulointerstitial nephritis antigen-like n=1 Tax=Folsomia candida TaxID=158441 RepID=A0A226F394_FOLCA|nr:Tubulointerstitial nephritis antigen-like [Folsomia candida]
MRKSKSSCKYNPIPMATISDSTFFVILLVSCLVVNIGGQYLPAFYGPFADIQGDYCAARIGGCCPGRIDDCSVPILGTLCYCDRFCNRTDNPDCCPDYFSACMGMHIIKPPEEVVKLPRCFQNGHFVEYGSSVKINCNQCKCDKNPSDPTKFELLCERDTCMIDGTLIQAINEGDYSWSAGNYSDFWGRKLSRILLFY